MKLTKQSKDTMLCLSKTKYLHYAKNTSKTNALLSELYSHMKDAEQYVKNHLTYTHTLQKITNASHIPKPTHFNKKSFPEMALNHIDKTSLTEIYYSFSLQDRKIKVYFVVEQDRREIQIGIFNQYIEHIAMWLHMINKYASKECVDTLHIYLYLTSLKKTLPSSNMYILNETNVNTAFTTTCPKESEIVVFRREEWFKVFIHETFHNFSLDFSIMNNDSVHKCIRTIYKVQSNVNAYEAYTEFWAEIINAAFCGYSVTHDKQGFLSMTELYINFERAHSLFQLVKTLEFMGLEYKDLYANTKVSIARRENLYKENTNVLSYYIIKTVLLYHYQAFLSWCKEHNTSLLQFQQTFHSQQQFCRFIEKHYKTSPLLESLYEAHLFLSTIREKKTNNHRFLLSTMRMSVCELG